MHCDVISMIFAYYSKLNFSRKKPGNELLSKKLPRPIFRYLYTEVKKRGGEISLHKHVLMSQFPRNVVSLLRA